jgi:glucose-6-phosphate 1-dehydrogenase
VDEKVFTNNPQQCKIIEPDSLEPCTIVIFGASGDLTARKLVPSLYKLFETGNMPDSFSIVGCSRSAMTDEEFQNKMYEAVQERVKLEGKIWKVFAQNLFYHIVAYDSEESFQDLANSLKQLDKVKNTYGNRIFYLAVPPTLYPVLATMVGKAGLSDESAVGAGWSRIVVEKPFGRDLKTALELDKTLHESFQEHQIFRIDHYLAKETVQNILMLRFANAIFEPIWNRSYIDYVGIIAAESLGVEHRAGYYEQAGVLRDMFQNHMKQLLALTAMEPPSLFEADRVRDEKVKVFRSLKPLEKGSLNNDLILGQYSAGSIDGKPVPAYRDEEGVDPQSFVPTFALMRMFIDNWRWRGVPFYLASGKRLGKKATRIVVQFKDVPHALFRPVIDGNIQANRLILGIYPDEEITLTFQTKTPGSKVCMRPVTMDFKYYDNYSGEILDAYARVLLDCILGDHMLFWRQDGVELAWSFLTPILQECETCPDPENTLHMYESGSWGPAAAKKWMDLILDPFER